MMRTVLCTKQRSINVYKTNDDLEIEMQSKYLSEGHEVNSRVQDFPLGILTFLSITVTKTTSYSLYFISLSPTRIEPQVFNWANSCLEYDYISQSSSS